MDSPRSSFRISIRDEGWTRVIAPHGELDMHTATQLQEAFNSIDGMKELILDLRGLTFLDSQGLRAVLWAAQGSRRRGLSLRLVPGGRNVQRVFEITGTTDRVSWVEEETPETEEGPSSA